jgi:hypothetical protein
MASCSHVQWLRLHQDQGTFNVHYSGRLYNLQKSLPRPSEQYPSLLFFIGRSSKLAALRSMYPESRLSTYRHHGIANICVDPATLEDRYPALIADSYPNGPAQVSPSAAEEKCHETTSQQVDWPIVKDGPPDLQEKIDLVNARLLSLFIDVLCIFADDCGGLAGIVTKLASWAALGSASSLPRPVRPRVVVVARTSGDTFDSEVLHFRSQLFSNPNFSDVFASLTVINLAGRPPSSAAQHGALKDALADETGASRLARADSSTLFSFAHTASFFQKALTRFAKRPESLFSFIRASRDDNEVNPELQHHICRFMSLCLEHKVPDSIPLPFIASALLLDSYPPDMHST